MSVSPMRGAGPGPSLTSAPSSPSPGFAALSSIAVVGNDPSAKKDDAGAKVAKSVAWVYPENTDVRVQALMESGKFISEMTDSSGIKGYLKFLQYHQQDFKEGPNKFLPISKDNYDKLLELKQRIKDYQAIINRPPGDCECCGRYIPAATAANARLGFSVVVGLAAAAALLIPESVFFSGQSGQSNDKQSNSGALAGYIITKLVGISGGIFSGISIYKKDRKQHKLDKEKKEAQKKIKEIDREIDKILNEEKTKFVGRARRLLFSYVQYTPKYLRQLEGAGKLKVEERIRVLAQDLFLQKMCFEHWKPSLKLLNEHIFTVVRDQTDVDNVLKPLVDAVVIMKLENEREGEGLKALIATIDQPENSMEAFYRRIRATQEEQDEAKLV